MKSLERPTAINLVTDPAGLDVLAERLGKAPRIACDTEAASFHRYRDRVFLIQLSSDTETAIVDPLAVEDLSAIGELLADPGIEIVFHDADFDLRSLDRDYRFRVRNVFDTRIAAQLVGEPSIGLGYLLEKYYQIKVDKKYQRADWSRRPLEPGMLEYAAGDTSHLLKLRDEMAGQLATLGRLEWARAEFKRLEDIRWTANGNTELAFLKMKGTRGLDSRALGILSELYTWRDREAQAQDRPPFKVVGNHTLLAIARAAPDDQPGLLKAGLPASTARRYGAQLLKAAQRGAKNPFAAPRKPRQPRERSTVADGVVDRLKSWRNKAAEELGIEPGVLCPNGTLQAIARAAPVSVRDLDKVAELRTWQIEAMGAEGILKALR